MAQKRGTETCGEEKARGVRGKSRKAHKRVSGVRCMDFLVYFSVYKPLSLYIVQIRGQWHQRQEKQRKEQHRQPKQCH